MSETSFKRLILRAVLRDVYPMVIRLVAVPDYLELGDFDDVFRSLAASFEALAFGNREGVQLRLGFPGFEEHRNRERV